MAKQDCIEKNREWLAAKADVEALTSFNSTVCPSARNLK